MSPCMLCDGDWQVLECVGGVPGYDCVRLWFSLRGREVAEDKCLALPSSFGLVLYALHWF